MLPEPLNPVTDEKRPIVLFADDFGRHPSNSQHLAMRMAKDRRILWVNTIGTRKPRLCAADVKRAFGKISQWIRRLANRPADSPSKQSVPHNIRVVNPLMWPGFGTRLSRWFNAWSMARTIERATEGWFDQSPVVLTTLPIAADLADRLDAHRWLYYAVDDWTAWPGLDHKTLAAMEADLIGSCDSLAAVSETLAARLSDKPEECELIDHGIDAESWRSISTNDCSDQDKAVLEQIEALPSPRAVYWGLIDDRLDYTAVARMAEHHEMSVALVGPIQGEAKKLEGHKGVHYLGPIGRASLPLVAEAADVLIAPYVESAATRAMQPLKLKEYLATDRPVVCTRLPSTQQWDDCCDAVPQHKLADRAAESAFLGSDPSQIKARQRRLEGESWESKAARLDAWIERVSAETQSQQPEIKTESTNHYPRLAWDRAA